MKLDAETLDLAFRAAEMRKDLDAVLDKHGARLQMGWHGKWAYLQAVWPSNNAKALTLMKVDKQGRRRYMTEAEEMARDPGKGL